MFQTNVVEKSKIHFMHNALFPHVLKNFLDNFKTERMCHNYVLAFIDFVNFICLTFSVLSVCFVDIYQLQRELYVFRSSHNTREGVPSTSPPQTTNYGWPSCATRIMESTKWCKSNKIQHSVNWRCHISGFDSGICKYLEVLFSCG